MLNHPPFDALPAVKIPPFVTRISDHGAQEGGEIPSTTAFSRAIAACSEHGGGTVVVPPGVWLTGPIHLCSSLRLHLERGAEIRFSRIHSDYLPPVLAHRAGCWVMNYSPFLYARDAHDIAITGEGVLDGQGDAWWDWKNNEAGVHRLIRMVAEELPVSERIFATEEDEVRPNMIEFVNCENLLFEGFSMRESPAYFLHPVGCTNVTVRNVSLLGNGPNNDGIDPEYCRNVLIEDCFIDTGDDCVCIKAGRDQDGWKEGRPTENVVVRRIRTRRGHGGIVIGSELSAGVRNVWVEDCEFTGTERGIRIKTAPGRGGFVENVCFRQIRMSGILEEAIIIHMDYGSIAKGQVGSAFESSTRCLTRIEGITLEDISVEGADRALDLTGEATQPLSHLKFHHLVAHAKHGPSITHAQDVVFEKTQFLPEEPAS